jgi:hypothetical protein
MEFLIADILVPTFDFIWNGIEWVLGILFGYGATGSEFSLAQGGPDAPIRNRSGTDEPIKIGDAYYGGSGVQREKPKFMGALYFPAQDTLEQAKRPQIRFSCVKMKYDERATRLERRSAYFPCPSNIAFGDAANLGSIDLGTVGAAMDAIQNRGGTASGKMVATFEAAYKAAGKTIGAAVDAATGGGITKQYFVNKAAVNQFTNTTFQGNNVRNFTFNFKLVAQSQKESDMITAIDHFFRINMYGGAQEKNLSEHNFNTFLSYPPVWEIDFLESVSEKEGAKFNEYLPKIFAAYLGGYNATFNTTAAAWHPGGAPLEVDMSLTFSETRALNAVDIKALDDPDTGISGNYYEDEITNMARRGIGNKGRATAAPDNSLDKFILESQDSKYIDMDEAQGTQKVIED